MVYICLWIYSTLGQKKKLHNLWLQLGNSWCITAVWLMIYFSNVLTLLQHLSTWHCLNELMWLIHTTESVVDSQSRCSLLYSHSLQDWSSVARISEMHQYDLISLQLRRHTRRWYHFTSTCTTIQTHYHAASCWWISQYSLQLYIWKLGFYLKKTCSMQMALRN